MQENIFKKITKIFFSNRDVILYSFSIDSNISYLTKCVNSKYSGIYEVSKPLYIFPRSVVFVSNTVMYYKTKTEVSRILDHSYYINRNYSCTFR